MILDNQGADKRTAEGDRLRGRILLEQGRTEESVAAYQQALGKDKELPGARLELARALYDEDHFAEAQRELEIVLSRQSGDLTAAGILDEVKREIEMRKNEQ
jgi:predicted negative regulator of RcsB-dependent stress response